jgi:hypothetical protein
VDAARGVAARAQALDAAVAANNGRLDELDRRRDVAARYIGELQSDAGRHGGARRSCRRHLCRPVYRVRHARDRRPRQDVFSLYGYLSQALSRGEQRWDEAM